MQKIIVFILMMSAFHVQCISQNKLFDQPVQLKSCKVSINANAFVATTNLELEFYNSNDSVVEGRQIFTLNRGQVVTGFQLELNGKYRDGSIEERRKARVAYSSVIGKRIDPALLQMIYQDNYSLNIYPIPAHGSRKVIIKVLQLMQGEKGKLNYEFPLSFTGRTDSLSIDINVGNTGLQAVTNEGLLQDKIFTTGNSNTQLHFIDRAQILNKKISFSILLDNSKPQVCISKTKGRTNFFIRFSPTPEKKYESQSKLLAVFWDVSSSATTRNIPGELNFLEKYIEVNKIEYVKIFLFNQQLQESFIFQTGKSIISSFENYIENYNYKGATQLGNLDLSVPGAGSILIFSDGINSFGTSLPRQGTVPVNCIVSGDKFDVDQLQKIVSTTGGQIIQLNKNNIVNAIAKTGGTENFIMSYRSMNNAVNLNETFPMKIQGPVFLSGSINQTDTLALVFGNDHSINSIQKFYLPIDTQDCDTELYGQLTLLHMYDSLMYSTVNTWNGWDQQLIFGLLNKVVTTQTSYLVLERIEDYIKYRIAPPKELEQQCAEMNYVYSNDYLIKTMLRENDMQSLKYVAENYNNKITWWDKTLPAIDLENPLPVVKTQGSTELAAATIQNGTNAPQANMATGKNTQELTAVVVTSLGAVRQKASLGYATSSIRSRDLTMANPVNLQDGLAGKVSGLNIQTTNSGIMSSTRITLRGVRSLTGNNQPLLVLDGTPVPLSYLSSINPNDVTYIDVLKSSSAAALWGSDGANGAVLVSTKKGRNSYMYSSWSEYKLDDVDDVDYIKDIRDISRDNLWNTYKDLEKYYSGEQGFYLDMADLFFEKKLEEKAMTILYEAAEQLGRSAAGKKAVAYLLEKWKKFDDAILIYNAILANNKNDLATKRDLALAYYQNGSWQQSLDIYYSIITTESEHYYYDYNQSIKATAMDEMNAVIAIHKEELDLSKINISLVRPLPVDLKISIEGNMSINNFQVIEPGGELCNYSNQHTQAGGYFSMAGTAYYSEAAYEYEIKNARKGKYRIKVDAYNYTMYEKEAPNMVRVLIFKNFQKMDQSLEIKNIILDNQYGIVEIADTKW